jgi:hypothetical protein
LSLSLIVFHSTLSEFRHPLSFENQKKVLVAEQRGIDKIKSEQEAVREGEMQQYEQAGDISQRDSRAQVQILPPTFVLDLRWP